MSVSLAISSFYITYVFLLTTTAITLIEALRSPIPQIRHIMNLETCISIVASYFYGLFIEEINKAQNLYNVKDDNKDNTALVDLRNKIGEKGASPERLSSYGDACRAFIIREAKGAALKASRYGEIQYTLNLSVTIDGVWGNNTQTAIKKFQKKYM